MERFVFIHGSSVGQSAFVPADAPELICNDIAAKYFQGRTLRQKESAAMKAMFVDLYHSSHGIYSVYSFVNNACFGANGREGQYFAISILCKGVYIYPEFIYNMLNSAYDTIFKNGKILKEIENNGCQYVISQFSEQKDYLAAFLKKVEDVFDKLVSGEGKAISPNVSAADYDSWHGYKVSLDVCNSTSAQKALTEVGRLYISEEYESASVTINTLRTQVQRLQAEKTEIETKHIDAKRSQKSKERDEIEELNSQVRQKDIEINILQRENENYEASIDVVRKELDKYAKVGKAVADFQNKRSQSQSKGWQDMLKWCLLILIFVLTLFSALANFGFFRNLSPLPEKEQTGEIKEVVGGGDIQEAQDVTSLGVSPDNISFDAIGGTRTIIVTTDGEWTVPEHHQDWISFTKIDNNSFEITVSANKGLERHARFILNAGIQEKQLKVTQEGAINVKSGMDYGIIIKDKVTNAELTNESSVLRGQKLAVSVSKPIFGTNVGWIYVNCTGNESNQKDVNVTVNEDASGHVIITYGDKKDPTKRQSYKLSLE